MSGFINTFTPTNERAAVCICTYVAKRSGANATANTQSAGKFRIAE